MRRMHLLAIMLIICISYLEADGQIIVDGAGLSVKGGALVPDGQFILEDVLHNTIATDVWVGESDGSLTSCDSSGNCTVQRLLANNIRDMAVFSGRLWVGLGSNLSSCDGAGNCIDHGTQGQDIECLAVFSGRLWIGCMTGHLMSCDSSGACFNHGDQGTFITQMAVFANRLWIGQIDGYLKACDDGGNCTSYGQKGSDIWGMTVYDGKLWLGMGTNLKSCDKDGNCTNYGNPGISGISDMTAFDGQLWFSETDGTLKSCNSKGVCLTRDTLNNQITKITVHKGKLLVSEFNGSLWSCDSTGNCTRYSDQVPNITAMAVFEPASLGNAVYTRSGNVGIGNSNPEYALDVTGDRIRLAEATGDDWIALRTDGSLIDFSYGGDGLVIQGSTDSEHLYLNPGKDSNVSIGGWGPTEKLDVDGNARIRSIPTGSGTPLLVQGDGTLAVQASDRRMKQNIRPLNDAFVNIDRLRGVRFNWRDQHYGGSAIGLVAQEIENVYPELVYTNPTDGYKGIRYPELTAVLLEAVKALKEKNSTLESRLMKQQTQLDQLIRIYGDEPLAASAP
ncbi:MAG: tail fiber domain-containing protein [Desulfobacteraceae bacterium]|nr:MAG: tail fiber domain-containing protein [Desulfobacteraceae bacterium]